jgi:hypothetical protein
LHWGELPNNDRLIEEIPFPIQDLPLEIMEVVKAIKEAMQVPDVLAYAGIQSSISASCGGLYDVQIDINNTHPITTNFLIICESGDRKTSTDNMASQAIYEWRGCINAFEYLPKDAFVVEFYSTFRVGDPACDKICSMFKDCWMFSKSDNVTEFGTVCADDNYVYLFRSWRRLLETARTMNSMWIYNFSNKIVQMRKLHEKLGYSDELDGEFEDDLPAFLRSISSEELDALIQDIEQNMVSEKLSKYKFYTVHSYKGMENPIIRIADDVDGNENIHYQPDTPLFLLSIDEIKNIISKKIMTRMKFVA